MIAKRLLLSLNARKGLATEAGAGCEGPGTGTGIINRYEGAALILAYVAYNVLIVVRALN